MDAEREALIAEFLSLFEELTAEEQMSLVEEIKKKYSA